MTTDWNKTCVDERRLQDLGTTVIREREGEGFIRNDLSNDGNPLKTGAGAVS